MTLAILYMGGTHRGRTREYSSKRNKRERKKLKEELQFLVLELLEMLMLW